MAFRFSIVSDVREVLRGNEAMERGFEDTADSVDDLARAAQRSGDKVSREFRDAGDDVEKVARDMERKFRDATDEISKTSRRAGDDLGDNVRRGARDADDSVGEFKDEARQNFGEITSSFTGDMDSIVDLAQGTFGGLAGTLTGPLGLAFGGLAASAGLFYSAWQENAEKTEQRISDMYDDLSESGSEFLSKEYLSQAINDILTGADGAAASFEDIQKQAQLSGIEVSTLLRAWAGDQDAINEVLGLTTEKQDAIRERFDGGALDAPSRRVVAQLQDIQNGLQGVTADTDSARAKTELYDEAVKAIPERKGTYIFADPFQAQQDVSSFISDVNAMRGTVGVDVSASRAQAQAAIDEALRGIRPVFEVAAQVSAAFRRP